MKTLKYEIIKDGEEYVNEIEIEDWEIQCNLEKYAEEEVMEEDEILGDLCMHIAEEDKMLGEPSDDSYTFDGMGMEVFSNEDNKVWMQKFLNGEPITATCYFPVKDKYVEIVDPSLIKEVAVIKCIEVK